ncbi:MAG: enoyl-CoA hydratase/isomerase family protein [Desulfobacteraceae bacterium]|nr:enoyl-CoA hydratase/isomerase family protein [Desulfobacteraceae bacterium]
MEESIKLRIEDEIALVTLNRPKAYNAFDLPMVQLLADRLIALALDPGVSGVVITGKGRICPGARIFPMEERA